MFGSRKNIQTFSDSPGNKASTTIIGTYSNFEGTLNSEGTVRIDGVFNGMLNVDGNIIIGESGFVKGNINADRVTIAGRVEGNVSCKNTFELLSNGRLYGDIEAKNISIEDGAVFQGKCTMMPKEPVEIIEIQKLNENPPAASE